MRKLALALLALLLGRGRRSARTHAPRILPELDVDRGAETRAILLLFAAAACFVAFLAVYVLDRIPHQTQWLGLALGGGLACLASALIITGRRLIVTEELVEEYPPQQHAGEVELIAQVAGEAGDRLTRRRLFKLGLVAAGGGLATAALAPAASFGPFLRAKYFFGTPWRSGRRLVDEDDRPIRADEISERELVTAFAEGADKEELGASLVLVRLPKAALKLPPELEGFDAGGVVAYSKICTHAGCAVSIYRTPIFERDAPGNALVCPCHYSTFDPARGGAVTFGPAGRPLPMLPLTVDARGFLRARGNFNDPVGPSWWGVRNRDPNP